MRVAVEAYESDEYRELSKLRGKANENSTFIIMEGLDEASKIKKRCFFKSNKVKTNNYIYLNQIIYFY